MEIKVITDFCREHLDFETRPLDYVNFYFSLPLAVIDAVFSIGAHYNSTKLAVLRFSEYFDLMIMRGAQLPLQEEQLSVGEFLEIYKEYGAERMAAEIYGNRQRTSSHSGVLKAEAARRFAQVLADCGVNYFQDVPLILGSCAFEQAIKEIPGQHSGVSLRYFYMLVGDADFIKPDRMIKRFLFAATGERLSDEECQELLAGACAELKRENPELTPRALDSLIWAYQRKKK